MRGAPWLAAVAMAGVGLSAGLSTLAHAQSLDADAPVAVRLNLDRRWYAPGDHGHVTVRLGADAYLLVLHAEPDGHVQIVFPVDPADNDFVHADSMIGIRSRGDRDAFIVDDSSGSGTWYAAVSKKPYHFDPITLSTHWDYRQIPHVLAVRDAEGDLTALVQRLATARFDYDVVQYHIDLAGGRDIAATNGAPSGPPAPPPPPDDPDGPWWLGPWGVGPWGFPGWGLPRPLPNPGPLYNRVAPAGVAGAGRTAPAGGEPSEPRPEAEGHRVDHGGGGGGSSPHH